jgi:hypothetical protein
VSFLLIISLLDYEMPLSLPYLSQTTTKGLLDIAVVVFLVNVYSILEIKRQAHLCKAMLRTYCEERYPRERQDFILLKWGVDLLFDKVTRGTYGSSKVWHTVLAWSDVLIGFGTQLVLLGLVVMVLWGVVAVLLDPSFGIFSIVAVLAALGAFSYAVVAWVACGTKALHIEQRGLADRRIDS